MSDMTPALETPAPPDTQDDEITASSIYRLTVEQYHQMIAAGILTDDDPIELLGGWLVEKMGKKPPHSVATRLTVPQIKKYLPDTWFVDTQEPITTADSEPEPDIAVIRGDPRDYLEHHPTPADIAMIVEVSDTTLQRDRVLKQQIYARAGIPVYWILNLVERTLEVHTQPDGTRYALRTVYSDQQRVPLVIAGETVAEIAVAALLP
jgi:Uma2 family endonuclease